MNQPIAKYTERFNVILKLEASKLRTHLENLFSTNDAVCWISTRAKSIDSFLAKASRENGNKRVYEDPLNEIQDQIGALIITKFLSDVEAVEQVIQDHFGGIERLEIEPESESEFGYVGRHYILFLPTEVQSSTETVTGPDFFELQIKTLFQYAWSETNHAIGYKPNQVLTPDQKRLSAFVAAQAWGADQAVNKLRQDLYSNSSGSGADA